MIKKHYSYLLLCIVFVNCTCFLYEGTKTKPSGRVHISTNHSLTVNAYNMKWTRNIQHICYSQKGTPYNIHNWYDVNGDFYLYH